jgi:hypothetical protein
MSYQGERGRKAYDHSHGKTLSYDMRWENIVASPHLTYVATNMLNSNQLSNHASGESATPPNASPPLSFKFFIVLALSCFSLQLYLLLRCGLLITLINLP